MGQARVMRARKAQRCSNGRWAKYSERATERMRPMGVREERRTMKGKPRLLSPNARAALTRRALRIGARPGVALEEAFELGDDQQKQVGDVGPYIAP